MRTAQRLAAISNEAVRGTVEYGVRTAYTVIDEYMRRGREAAADCQKRPDWRNDMNDNRCNYSSPYGAWGPMWSLITPWVQAMQAWTCAMSGFVPGAAAQSSWSQCAMTPRVSVKVSSRDQTNVSAHVEPGADTMNLSADPLKSSDARNAAVLNDVTIESECGQVRIDITVPDGQPAGVYRGVIRDTCGCKRGDLTVEIARPARRPPRGTRKGARKTGARKRA